MIFQTSRYYRQDEQPGVQREAKVEKGEEKSKEAENEEKPDLPPGWTFSVGGKVGDFVLQSSLFPD